MNEKMIGAFNPNKKYHYDENIFKNIDSEFKAYLLGLIASDGHVRKSGFNIFLHKKDWSFLERIKNTICPDLPRQKQRDFMWGFSVNSIIIAKDIYRLLKINPGKKSHTVQMPEEISEDLKRHFVRGFFDGDGCVAKIAFYSYKPWPSPLCYIKSNSNLIRKQIGEFLKIPFWDNGKSVIQWQGSNAIDVMSKLYDNSNYFLTRKKDRYIDWCTWTPGLSGHCGKEAYFKYVKTDKAAVVPSKSRASDSGYDLTIIKKNKEVGNLVFYDTCIKIQPIHGYYFDMVPRSSMPKTGYLLANCIGVIDRSYVGSIQVCLTKIDKNAPDLELPSKIVQIIPRPIIHCELVEGVIDDTQRGENGFGSSGV